MPTTNQGLLDAYNALFSNTPFGAAIRRRVLGGMQQSRRITGSGTRGGSSMPRGTGGEDTEPNMMGGRDRSGPPDYSTPNTAVNTSSGALPGSTPPSSINASGRISPTGTGLPASWSPMSTAQTGIGFRGWNNAAAKKAAYGGLVLGGPIGAGLGYVGGGFLGGLTRYSPRFPGQAMPRFMTQGSGGAPAYGPTREGLQVGRFDRDRFGWGGFDASPQVDHVDPFGGGGYGEGGYGNDAGSPSGGEPGDAGLGYM